MRVKASDTVMICRLQNEAEFMLERFLAHNSPFFDHFIAFVDRSKDKTLEIVSNHPKCIMVINRKTGGYNQKHDYQMLREAANYFNHEWLLFLDADELISHETLSDLHNVPDETRCIGLRYALLFDNEKTMIANTRMTNAPDKFYRRDHILGWKFSHRCLPRIMEPIYILDGLIYHYSFYTENRRVKRATTYKHDAKHEYSRWQTEIGWIRTVDISFGNRTAGTLTELSEALKRSLKTENDKHTKNLIQCRIGECNPHIFVRFPYLQMTMAEFKKVATITNEGESDANKVV